MKPLAFLRQLGALCLAGFALASCGTTEEQARPDWLYPDLGAEEVAVARTALQQALETRSSNEGYVWESEAGGSGVVTPLRTFRITTGHYCRDYQEAVTTLTDSASETRTACRDGKGIWRRVVKP